MQFFRLFLYILAFISLHRNTAAYFYTNNGCMKVVKREEKIDLNQLSGKWYEFSKYPSSITLENNCAYYNMEVLADNVLDVKITNRKYGIDYILNGTGTLNEDGSLSVHYDQRLGTWQNIKYSIIEIDYENYLMLFSCIRESSKSNHYNNMVWVLTRQPVPDTERELNVATTLTNHEVSLAPLFRTNQRNCGWSSAQESAEADETKTETEKDDLKPNEMESITTTTEDEDESESTSGQNSEEIPHTHLAFETIIANLNFAKENENQD